MTSQLDIEFLSRPRLTGRNIVYLYRSGILKPEVIRALEDCAREHGLAVSEATPEQALEYAPLDGLLVDHTKRLLYCDWKAAPKSYVSTIELAERIAASADDCSSITAHFMPYKAPFIDLVSSPDFEQVSQIIIEPVVGPGTMLPVLRFLDTTTGLLDQQALAEDPLFVSRFTDLIGYTQGDLARVCKEYKEQVISCTNPVTRKFNPLAHEDIWRRDAAPLSPYGKLKVMLATGSHSSVDDFVTALGNRMAERKWQGQTLFRELCNMTARLVSISSLHDNLHRTRGKKHGQIGRDKIALLAGLLLAWEQRMAQDPEMAIGSARGPQMASFALDAVCQEFKKQSDLLLSSIDPLQANWKFIDLHHIMTSGNSLAKKSLARLGKALLTNGTLVGSARWLLQLKECFQTLTDWLDKHDTIEEVNVEVRDTSRYTLFSGNEASHSSIRRRYSKEIWKLLGQQESINSLIVHGAPGTDKLTSAMLYARSVFCKVSEGRGNACGNCSACVEGGSPIGYIDANSANVVAGIEGMAEPTGHWSLFQLVYIIDNIDTLRQKDLDPLLKTLETSKAVFIFTADNLRAVRPAIRSRCIDLPVSLLNDNEASELVLSRLKWDGQSKGELAKLLVALARGNEKKILNLIALVNEHPEAAFDEVTAILGLDWPLKLDRAWPATVGHGETFDVLELFSATNLVEAIARVRSLLAFLFARAGGSGNALTDPAFGLLDEESAGHLWQQFTRYAEICGSEPLQLCCDLSGMWLSRSVSRPAKSRY